ncbi:hypothetical protein [Pseudomonas aeruginosa]|uniref:hypothetical protein n=1 Tax=Pseudomonas aeruginosa TaxID=287 RepID=UPI003966CAAE
MNSEITDLTSAPAQLLARAAIEISTYELRELVNTSVQFGPPITLNGPLFRVEKNLIAPVCWAAMMEFVDWGAAILSESSIDQSTYLLIDMAQVDRMFRYLERKFNSRADQQGENTKQLIIRKPVRKSADNGWVIG